MTSSVSAAAPARGGLAVAAALAIVYVVWGSTYLGIRFALEGGFPPLLMVSGSRFVAAGLVLYLFLRWRGVAAPTRAQWKNLLVMGALLLLMGNGMVVLAEQTVSSGLAAVAVAKSSHGARATSTGASGIAASRWFASFSVAARPADSSTSAAPAGSNAASRVASAVSIARSASPSTATGQPRRIASIARAAALASLTTRTR